MEITFGLFLHQYGGGGLLSGFLHPILGLQHLLAMVAVGLVSAQLGGTAVWKVPATFVVAMTLGGILGIVSVPLPLVDLGIAGSVILLGLAIAAKSGLPKSIVYVIIAIFGLLHGHAHGTSMPAEGTIALIVTYIIGFLVATIGLHVIGALLGMIAVQTRKGDRILRVSGGLIAVLGVAIIAGAL